MLVGSLQQLLLQSPYLVDQPLDDLHQFWVLLILVVEEPGALLGDRHIGSDGHAMMQREMAEVHLVASVSLECLVLELLEVDELRLVDDEIVERHRVGRARAVLRDDVADGAVVETDGVLPVRRREDRRFPVELLPRSPTHHIV